MEFVALDHYLTQIREGVFQIKEIVERMEIVDRQLDEVPKEAYMLLGLKVPHAEIKIALAVLKAMQERNGPLEVPPEVPAPPLEVPRPPPPASFRGVCG